MARVGLAFNFIPTEYLKRYPIDFIAEYDTVGAVQAYTQALESRGHVVIPLEADQHFPARLLAANPDIVFNLSEGLRGESREAQVPAICDMLGMPYTGSPTLTMALCQNKNVTNVLLRDGGLPIPPFQVFHSAQDALDPTLTFPLIVKLLHEGSSMGLTSHSVVHTLAELIEQVEREIDTYHEPVLVQKFIKGREFTVGVLGNHNPQVLPPVEVIFQDPDGIVTFELDEDMLPLVARERGEDFVKKSAYRAKRYQSICPAQVSDEVRARIETTVLAAYRIMGCLDWCRIDTRMDADGTIYVLELNPLAGAAPGYWLPRAAAAAGMDYAAFINRILDLAIERYRGNGWH